MANVYPADPGWPVEWISDEAKPDIFSFLYGHEALFSGDPSVVFRIGESGINYVAFGPGGPSILGNVGQDVIGRLALDRIELRGGANVTCRDLVRPGVVVDVEPGSTLTTESVFP